MKGIKLEKDILKKKERKLYKTFLKEKEYIKGIQKPL